MYRLLAALLVSACAPAGPPGTTVVFDPDADLRSRKHFFDFPYPSDQRLANGAPDLTGWPNPRPGVIDPIVGAASERKGFPVVPVAYFRFTGPIAPRDPTALIAADRASPLLLVDVDPASPERGRLLPIVAHTPPSDDYVPDDLLAVAPRPGFVLVARRTYAFVVLRSLGDATGRALDVAPRFTLGEPLSTALRTAGVDPAQVAAATVFTTGDVVQELFDLSTAVMAVHRAEVHDLAPGPTVTDRYCQVVGKVRQPQFQRGEPPFNTEGLFDFSGGAVPAKQRDEEIPIAFTLPKSTMPAAGFPLLIYFHGSGGVSTSAADWGRSPVKDGAPAAGKGPAYYHSAIGLATVGAALPINPQRFPGATEIAYINLANPVMMRDLFRQGVIEQRLLLEALRTVEIPPAALGACAGPKLPQGVARFKLDLSRVVAQGQSMGGMYVNLVSAVEPRIRASVPTGAGGFWTWFLLQTKLLNRLPTLISLYLGARDELSFMHPALHLLQTALEPADPMVSMPRLGRRPLAGHPARPVYEPVGKDDSYFPSLIFDAMALAYGHQQAGDEVWPEMQAALRLDGRDGMLAYPVKQNHVGEGGAMTTGVVVQYAGDFEDPHSIYRQLDEVKYQYSCFLSTFLDGGVAVVPAPAPLGTPCPK